jgi:hypothetical protein
VENNAIALDRREPTDFVMLAKDGNKRFAKFMAKLESEGYYGRVSFLMKDGEIVGAVDTNQTHKI